jgi:hypothetical protein
LIGCGRLCNRRSARHGQELLGYDTLLQDRLKLIVNNERLVNLVIFCEASDNIAGDLKRFGEFHPPFAGQANVFTNQIRSSPAKEISSLAPNCQNLNLLVGIVAYESLGRLDQIRIKGAAEAFVGGYQDEEIMFVAARVKQRVVEVFVSTISESAHNFHHLVGERSRCNYSVLCAFEFCSRDHLHGLSDLLRILYRFDASANV